jgi:cytochrome c oxidase assembly protein subunit 15/protoheme IX farnesyltransferase
MKGATAVEFTHRMASGLALVLVAGLVVWIWRRFPKHEPARLGASLALVAIVGEALIGALIVLAEWVADDTSQARAVAVPLHLVNTLFLLAALTLTVFWISGGGKLDLHKDRRIGRWILMGAIAIALIAATGAVTALADTLFPKHEFSVSSEHFLTRLRLLHPVLAIFGAAVGWWASRRSGFGRSKPALALPFLVGAMLVTGSLNIVLGVPVWMQVLHLALADGLWIAYVLSSAQTLQAEEVATRSVV